MKKRLRKKKLKQFLESVKPQIKQLSDDLRDFENPENSAEALRSAFIFSVEDVKKYGILLEEN